MHPKINGFTVTYISGEIVMIISLEPAGTKHNINSVAQTSGGTRINTADTETGGSSITSFEDMLDDIMSGEQAMTFGEDKIIQASEMSVKELTELYLKLGITSPAGKKAETNYIDNSSAVNDNTVAANYTASLYDDVCYPNCSVNVPEKYVDIFKRAADKYGISYELLVSVAQAESDFHKDCTSRSGAMGIMQLMPATAKYLGVTDAYDPEQNIMGGARYLSEKLEKHGSVQLALAAYNAGSNAVEKYGGIPPYSETQNYVKKIMGFLGVE